VLWLAVIAVESSDLLSSSHTGSFLYSMAVRLFGAIDPGLFEAFHAVLRKFGHFIGYAILSLLVWRALSATFRRTAALVELRWAAASIAFTFLIASFDELHQSFLPSRTGRFRDVVLDTAGAIFIQGVIFVAVRRHGRKPDGVAESVSN
jgi:VanZ family protein